MVVLGTKLSKRVRQGVQADLGLEVEKENKYRNKPVVEDGKRVAASGHEYRRLQELRIKLRAGLIRNLQCQVPFPLVWNGVKIGTYVADFVYSEPISDTWDGCRIVVEDAKGHRNKVYSLKRLMMKAAYQIDIRET